MIKHCWLFFFPVVHLSSQDTEKSCRILLHALQLFPQTEYRSHEFEKLVTIGDRGDTTQAFSVIVSFNCPFQRISLKLVIINGEENANIAHSHNASNGSVCLWQERTWFALSIDRFVCLNYIIKKLGLHNDEHIWVSHSLVLNCVNIIHNFK